MKQLLRCLPLLRAGNAEARASYTQVMPKILQHSIENGCHVEESRQLLSYWLIHPALTPTERSHFSLWLTHLEDRCTMVHHQGAGSASGETDSSSDTKANGWNDYENCVHSAAGPRAITSCIGNHVADLPSPLPTGMRVHHHHRPLHGTHSGPSPVSPAGRFYFRAVTVDRFISMVHVLLP